MIPLATAEIATDGWIQVLMKPVMKADFNIDSGYAIVCSSVIMMTLRFFAGVPLKYMSAPTLLLVSSIFSIIGLFMLSSVSGMLIIIAFVIFMLLKMINNMKKKAEEEPAAPAEDVVLLSEIRDLLKK